MKIPSEDAIIKRLILLRVDARRASENVKETMKKPFKAYFGVKGSFFLTAKGLAAFEQIICELKKDEETTAKFSDQNLERILNDVVVELLSVQENELQAAAKQQVAKLFETLATSAVDWTLVVPITNLDLEMSELKVGKVKFFKLGTDEKTVLQSRSGGLAQMLDEILEKNFLGKVCAKIIVSAVDEKRAEEIGIQEISIALDILRFYGLNTVFPYPASVKNLFDIQGNIHSDRQIAVLFSSQSFTIPHEVKGFLASFQVTNAALASLKVDGFDSFSKILEKNERDRTNVEKTLVTSVRFCALSTQDRQISNAFVNGTISLEALLLHEHEAKAENLAERIAFIIGKNLSERNWFFDEVRRLYRVRCTIVHSGNIDIRNSDLRMLQTINYRCIINMLDLYQSQKINNIADLVAWVRKQKFK